MTRQLSVVDRLIGEIDHGLRTVFCRRPDRSRANPAGTNNPKLDDNERRLSGRLMRVDHTGEVCAQALYRGQAWVARDSNVRTELHQAADEEQDHLAWCDDRIKQLGAHPSLLNPFWYGASFAIGAFSGFIGDQWSLGFVIATEEQVEVHIDDHLQRLPKTDTASRNILKQMQADEVAHADHARESGGKDLITFVMY